MSAPMAVPHRDVRDSIELRGLVAVSFTIFLVYGFVARLLPWRWLNASSTRPRASLFAEARMATSNVVPFMFMG